MIINGDCLEEMRKMEANSISCIVTDPPYGLHFMGKDWDKFKKTNFDETPDKYHTEDGRCRRSIDCANAYAGTYDERRNDEFQQFIYEWGIEALRIVKPGGHVLMFGAPRRFHRQTSGLEDAGWEIRDCLMWIFGSGFPKSHNISKGIDKKESDQFRKEIGSLIKFHREKLGLTMDEACSLIGLNYEGHGGMINHYENGRATPTLDLWKVICEKLEINGFSDYESKKSHRLKTIGEYKNPITWFARTELKQPTSGEALFFDGYGTALKPAYEPIIMAMKPCDGTFAHNAEKWGQAGINIEGCRIAGLKPDTIRGDSGTGWGMSSQGSIIDDGKGRWPANVLFDEEAAKMLDEQSGNLKSTGGQGNYGNSIYSDLNNKPVKRDIGFHDIGGASRFFYCAKTSSRERGEGNNHPTVKPLKLMQYLIKLVMPPKDGVLLDPFAGSGSTILAAHRLGVKAIGIEKSAEYCEIARARLAAKVIEVKEPDLFDEPIAVNSIGS
jgi:DNA modification methylase